jgi:hypothetical protein
MGIEVQPADFNIKQYRAAIFLYCMLIALRSNPTIALNQIPVKPLSAK